MGSENNELREGSLFALPGSMWNSVRELQRKYGYPDTELQLLEQGETISKPRIRQLFDAKAFGFHGRIDIRAVGVEDLHLSQKGKVLPVSRKSVPRFCSLCTILNVG